MHLAKIIKDAENEHCTDACQILANFIVKGKSTNIGDFNERAQFQAK